MVDVLHRVTKEYRREINPPYFPVADWIYDPNLSAVGGLPLKYWKIVGDDVFAMTQAERDKVDAEQAQIDLVSNRAAAKQELVSAHTLRAIILVILDEINVLRAKAGLALRTATQVESALRDKVDEL